MFSEKLLARLLEKTKEGAIRWQIIPSEDQKKYTTEYYLIRFEITSNPTGGSAGYGSKRYGFTFVALTTTKSILVNDSGEWSEQGPREEGANAMYELVCLIEEQKKKGLEEEFRKMREKNIEHILEKIQ